MPLRFVNKDYQRFVLRCDPEGNTLVIACDYHTGEELFIEGTFNSLRDARQYVESLPEESIVGLTE